MGGLADVKLMDEAVQVFQDARIAPAVIYQRAFKWDWRKFTHKSWQWVVTRPDDGVGREWQHSAQWCAREGEIFQQSGMRSDRKHNIDHELQEKYKVTKQELVLRFMMGLGVVPLISTDKALHMREALRAGPC